MSNFLPPRYRATDANGEPIAGAKLYFYTTGTTTPLATYSDAALTVANANPVVADGSGYFGAIYLQQAAYRVKLTDADGTQIYSVDGVRSSVLSDEDFITRLQQVATNPLDYGAVGDGVADESAEVQLAIDNATGVVDLLGKTFRCDSGVTLRSGLTLRNGTLDFSACASNYGVRILGTATAISNLTSDAAEGALAVTLDSVTGLSAGDWILVRKSAVWSTASGDSAEIQRVTGIVGTSVSLSSGLRDAYATVDSARASKIAAKSNVVIEKIAFQGATSLGDAVLIDVQYADNIIVRGCTFDSAKISAVSIVDSVNVAVAECVFTDCAGGAFPGAAIDVGGASESIFMNASKFINSTSKAVAIGINEPENDGVARNVSLSGCSFVGSALVVHLMSQHVRAYGCTFEPNNSGGGDGVSVTSDDVIFFGCLFRAPDYGIVPGAGCTNLSYFGNLFDCGTAPTYNSSQASAYFVGQGANPGVQSVGGPTGYGVFGQSAGAAAVYGISSGSYGVVAEGDTTSPAKAAFRIVPQNATPSGTNLVGDMYVNSGDSKLYLCTAAGSPGTWVVVGTQS